jgi:adenosylcobinamide hydrolase
MDVRIRDVRIRVNLDFPGVVTSLTADALVVRSERSLCTLASAVVGGGFTRTRCIVNRHVHKDYDDRDPAADLLAFARARGIDQPFVGLMTAVRLSQARAATWHDGGTRIATIVTAGVGNSTAAGLSPPAVCAPATVNVILLVDGNLPPSAMVGAVITLTEAKTQLLLERDVRTSEGHPATGTSTDAVVVACTGRGAPLPYAGPVTRIGWLIGRSVRHVLGEALA